MVHASKSHAEAHYSDLSSKPFFGGLTDFLSSGPVVAMVWRGKGVVKTGRKMLGETNPVRSSSRPTHARTTHSTRIALTHSLIRDRLTPCRAPSAATSRLTSVS